MCHYAWPDLELLIPLPLPLKRKHSRPLVNQRLGLPACTCIEYNSSLAFLWRRGQSGPQAHFTLQCLWLRVSRLNGTNHTGVKPQSFSNPGAVQSSPHPPVVTNIAGQTSRKPES